MDTENSEKEIISAGIKLGSALTPACTDYETIQAIKMYLNVLVTSAVKRAAAVRLLRNLVDIRPAIDRLERNGFNDEVQEFKVLMKQISDNAESEKSGGIQ